MKKSIGILLISLSILAFIGFHTTGESVLTTKTIMLNSTVMEVEIADTEVERQNGLSGRDLLSSDHGMLFVFETEGRHSFWMKNMRFPLDILWFNKERELVDMAVNLRPEGVLPQKVYTPKQEALYVLEVPSGWAVAQKVMVVDVFDFCSDAKCGAVSQKKAIGKPAPYVKHSVPFSPQAPFGKWSEPRYKSGCEEASIAMAIKWLFKKPLTQEEAGAEIKSLAAYEKERYGYFEDTSASDTAKLMREYYKAGTVSVDYNVSIEKIKKALAEGELVITPMNGRVIGNRFYTPPGPERHMILIIGYDDKTGEFITNDPGTKRGAGLRYRYEIFFKGIRDYPSGRDVPLTGTKKAMIVVSKRLFQH